MDSTTQKDHIYEYRVCGSDVYGNRSSYAFSMVLCAGKKSIRSPINLKSEVLRGSPFRVKISWDNDNLSQTLKKQLFQDNGDVVFNKLYYKVERRKKDEIYYASFPLTENQYIIDEAATIDAVTFNAQKTEDTHQAQPDMSASSTITTQNTLKRENNLPSFLLENDFYYYRIATISDLGDSSNPSPEFQLSTLPDLSEILNLQVKIINPKVVPPVIQLVWETQLEKLIPDYWLIERKINVATDVFSPVAKSYFSTEYYDKDVRLFKSYLYRITAFDSLGRKSKSVQIGIST